MKISVIIPVYNREKYLSEALRSVINQSYDNYEIIIIDDGSTDTSYDIALKFAAEYPNKIKVFKQINSGPSKAKNTGIKFSTGKYIAFLDSDDTWNPDKLKEQVEIAKKNEDFSFIYSGYNIIDSYGNIINQHFPDVRLSGYIYKKLWLINNTISGGTILTKKDYLLVIKGFDEDLQGAENLDLRLRLSKLGPVYFTNKILYNYRKHDSNLSSQVQKMNLSHMFLINKHFSNCNYFSNTLFRKVMSKYYYNLSSQIYHKDTKYNSLTMLIKSIVLDPSRIESYKFFAKIIINYKN